MQISKCIHAVCSKSSLGVFSVAKNAKFHHTDKEISDPSAQMRRLVWIFVWRTCQKLRFADVAIDEQDDKVCKICKCDYPSSNSEPQVLFHMPLLILVRRLMTFGYLND